MDYAIVNRQDSDIPNEKITNLLVQVFVGGGYSEGTKAEQAFGPDALTKRGDALLAVGNAGLLGLVICATAASPARQIAEADEAEMHLLAVDPTSRGQGVGSSLVRAFEERAKVLGFSKLVLSTQPTMVAAHRIYEQHGYRRNPSRDWAKGGGKNYRVYEKR